MKPDERFGTTGSDIMVVLAGKRDVAGPASPEDPFNKWSMNRYSISEINYQKYLARR
jgi:hypothetical protein